MTNLETSVRRPIVLFDGVCNFCNGTVRFVLKRERGTDLRFASLQSEFARKLVSGHYRSSPPDSLVLVEFGRVSDRSTAVLRLLRHLRWPWPLLYAVIIIPKALRDAAYDWFARHRYGWFGRRDEVCEIPAPQWKNRFLPTD